MIFRYYSTVTVNTEQNELSQTMGTLMLEALKKYKDQNQGVQPNNIIFYRDGVGEGQLQYVKEFEVKQILDTLKGVYPENTPRLTFIVVSKRIKPR